MNDLFDTVKDNFSKLPKWAWVAIIGGFGLVAYLGSRGGGGASYAPTPTYADPGLESNKVSESEVSNRINQVVSELTGKMEDNLQEQGSYFNQKLSEKDALYQEQLKAYQDGFNDRTNALTSSFQETNAMLQNQLTEVTSSLGQSIANEQKNNQQLLHEIEKAKYIPPAPVTPAEPVWKKDTFRTGIFGSVDSANKIAQELKNSYGGKNVHVINEGGQYRVSADFDQDEQKAERVNQRFQERGLIAVGYVKDGGY